MLFLPRQHSHAFLHEVSVQVSAGGFPYEQLLAENQRRTRNDPEYELLDTGVFNDNRYFDVVVEYAKVDIEDILIKITVTNRAAEAAPLHILPHLWFRNTWSWGGNEARPGLQAVGGAVQIFHPEAESRWLYCEGSPELLFTENETNTNKLFGSKESPLCKKDGINDYVVGGVKAAVSAEQKGHQGGGALRLRSRRWRDHPPAASSHRP